MRPVTANPDMVHDALLELIRASQENDIVDIAQNFTISGSFTPTYVLNLTSPTAANIAAVFATLITAMQKGGINRTS